MSEVHSLYYRLSPCAATQHRVFYLVDLACTSTWGVNASCTSTVQVAKIHNDRISLHMFSVISLGFSHSSIKGRSPNACVDQYDTELSLSSRERERE